MTESGAAPIILTALMDPAAFRNFDELRRTHFPPERNFIPAHITLFHHLPGTMADDIVADIRDEARHEAAMEARTIRAHFMGKGTSYIVECPALADFRARLASRWDALLVPQDRQGWRPHVTVQNKVDGSAAKRTFARLEQEFRPMPFEVLGATVWFYRGGPWEKIRDIRFRGRSR